VTATGQDDIREAVSVEGGTLRIHDLAVTGASAEWAARVSGGGGDVQAAVEQAIDLGSRVLLHGAALGTVDAVAAEVDRLLEGLDAKVALLQYASRAAARTSTKGLRYEHDLAPVLDACFAAQHDVVEDLSTTPGIGEDKTGDFVVTLNPQDTGGHRRRIVFEAKNQRLSMAAAEAELDDAMSNRAADVGVLVFAAQSQAPLHGKPLRILPRNRLMVVWSPGGDNLALEMAAQLARALARHVAEDRGGTLNRRVLAGRLERLITIIESAQDIERGLDGARTGLEKAQDAYELMREEALAELYEIQNRL
jgi:hypothetical protein